MYNTKVSNNLSESIYAGNSTAVNNLPSWLLKSDFSRNNTDLIATSPDGDQLTLIDYFINFELPNLYTDNGLQLKGSAVNYLAGPLAKGQYAQSTDVTVLSIGEVSTVSGTVKATRLDGTITNLKTNDCELVDGNFSLKVDISSLVLPDTFAEDKGATFTGILEMQNGVLVLRAEEVQMGCPSKYEPLEESS